MPNRTRRTPDRPASAARYPIRVVARMTGLSLDTLRAWERRYQVVTPGRGDRGRLYSDADVQRLTQLARLVDAGHAIGAVAALPARELARLAASAAPGGGTSPPAGAGPDIDLGPLLLAIKQYDLPALDRTLTRHAVLLPADELVFGVVLPALREIGARWESGTLRPAHEHLASAVIRHVLGGVLRMMPRHATGPTMVLATISGERHELGLLSAAVLAASAGYTVVYLGPDLPDADIVHAASQLAADVVVVSATRPIADPAAVGGLAKLKTGELWAGGTERVRVGEILGRRVRLIEDLEAFAQLVKTRGR